MITHEEKSNDSASNDNSGVDLHLTGDFVDRDEVDDGDDDRGDDVQRLEDQPRKEQAPSLLLTAVVKENIGEKGQDAEGQVRCSEWWTVAANRSEEI